MIERFEKYSAFVDPEQFAGSDFMKGVRGIAACLAATAGCWAWPGMTGG